MSVGWRSRGRRSNDLLTPLMAEYRVGQPYNPRVSSFPEGANYNWRSGAHELLLLFHRPTPAEVLAVRRGRADFGLVVSGDLLLLLYRFDPAVLWSDAPYSIHLLEPAERVIPDTTGLTEPHALLTVHLIDAGTGILRANRVVSLSPAFTAALHLAIREQAERAWPGAAEYDAQLADLYRRHPTTSDLLKVARALTGC